MGQRNKYEPFHCPIQVSPWESGFKSRHYSTKARACFTAVFLYSTNGFLKSISQYDICSIAQIWSQKILGFSLAEGTLSLLISYASLFLYLKSSKDASFLIQWTNDYTNPSLSFQYSGTYYYIIILFYINIINFTISYLYYVAVIAYYYANLAYCYSILRLKFMCQVFLDTLSLLLQSARICFIDCI